MTKVKSSKIQKATLFVTVITSFITTFTGSAIVLSVPDIAIQFSASAASVGWVITIYMLIASALAVPFGRLADLTHRKTVLVTGVVGFAITAFLAVFSANLVMLIAARGASGLFAAMIFATNHAVLISEFPEEERGRVLGYATASTYSGLSFGPVIGGFLNHYFGWESIFTVVGVIGTIVAIIAAKMLPCRESSIEQKGGDLRGNLLYVGMILVFLYGCGTIDRGMASALLVLTGFILCYFFVKWELRATSPIIDVRLFARNSNYSKANAAALMNYAANFAISYLFSIYLQVVKDMSSQTAGFVLIASPVIMALLSPYTGRLSDKTAPHKLASVGMLLCAISLFAMSRVTVDTSIAVIIAILLLSGIGFALFSTPNTNSVMSEVDKSSYSVAASLLATMRNLGHTISMVILTVIVRHNMGYEQLASAGNETLVGTMQQAFTVFTLICIVGVVIIMRRKEK